MEKVIYGSKMKKVDSYTMDIIGIPSMVLMERAAFSVFSYIKEHIGYEKKILCICGMGNNGADGVALARMLCLDGYKADVLTVGNEDKATQQWKEQKKIAINCGVEIVTADNNYTYDNTSSNGNQSEQITRTLRQIMESYDIVADAIFGIGITRNVEGIYASIIEAVNIEHDIRKNTSRPLGVYAIDIPSGLCADTGKIMGIGVKADITFTFGAMKAGLLLYKGKDFGGKIVKNDIGFPEMAYKNALEKSELCKSVEKGELYKIISRKQHSNKGAYGKILIVGGSENVYGAAYFSAMAACKTGCGLVKIITHENNRKLIYEKLPEAMINVYGTDEDEATLKSMIDEAIAWANVIVIGPGISKGNEAKVLLKQTMISTKNTDKHIIIDADGLNIIAENPELKEYYHKKTIITPHIGEASRLMGKSATAVAEDIVGSAGDYARKNNINVIQKDSTTVILGIESSDDKCNNRVCINTSGNAGMATGGSGDVLTGIVAAVLAGGVDVKELQEYKDASDDEKENEKVFLAASVGVYIHGLAGDMAAKEVGETSMTATDILNMIPRILKNHERIGS